MNIDQLKTKKNKKKLHTLKGNILTGYFADLGSGVLVSKGDSYASIYLVVGLSRLAAVLLVWIGFHLNDAHLIWYITEQRSQFHVFTQFVTVNVCRGGRSGRGWISPEPIRQK